MREPTFLILGAAKSATTTLCSHLAARNDVCLSRPKEPLFFEAEFERGVEYYLARYFAHWGGEPAVGEARVANLFLPYVPARVAETLPEARLVAVLREPAERAYAHWWMRRGWRGVEELSFEDALEENLERLRAGQTFDGAEGERRWCGGLDARTGVQRQRTYLDMGYYAEQLERYYALFDADRLRVVLFSDLVEDPVGTMNALFGFLGLESTPTGRPPIHENASLGPVGTWMRRVARACGVTQVLPAGWKASAQRVIRAMGTRPEMAVETQRGLVAHFREHNRRLERLIGRDLAAWGTARPETSRTTGAGFSRRD